jgi:hypothetical protein
VLFDYDLARPKLVMVDFTNTNPFDAHRKASAAFHAFPYTESEPDTAVGGKDLAVALGGRSTTLRFGARSNSISRSTSPSLSTSSRESISAAPLNPFAAPWPLPKTTPRVSIPNASGNSLPRSQGIPIPSASLPLPKGLPASLPPRPNVELPPVFVKRESAALPQPMALPDIAPLGHAWQGENSLSGNDKRRRASQMGLPPLPLSIGEGRMDRIGTSMVEKRPERLVKLGEKLRMSVAEQKGST